VADSVLHVRLNGFVAGALFAMSVGQMVPGSVRQKANLPRCDRFAISPWSVGAWLGIYISDIGDISPEITRSPSAWTSDQWVTPTDHCEHKEQK
jgi:hypothetical protein